MTPDAFSFFLPPPVRSIVSLIKHLCLRPPATPRSTNDGQMMRYACPTASTCTRRAHPSLAVLVAPSFSVEVLRASAHLLQVIYISVLVYSTPPLDNILPFPYCTTHTLAPHPASAITSKRARNVIHKEFSIMRHNNARNLGN